jgi:hypothetical protein
LSSTTGGSFITFTQPWSFDSQMTNHGVLDIRVVGATGFERLRDDIVADELREAALRDLGPIPMILTCPFCNERHVDRGEFATKPHHTHACQGCGHVWRPAIVATVGVQFLPGFKDEEE